MNRKKIAVGVVLTVLCTALILSGHLAAAPKYKEGDWLTKDEFFNLFELNEYIGWDLAGSNIGENISDSGLELYPVKIKASLHEVMLGPVSTAIHLATGSQSYVLNCNNLGKQILLGTEPVSISFSGGESVVPAEYGHFSYNYDITISNLTYSYNRVFSSLGSPFDAHHDTAGHVEAFGLYTTGPDDIRQEQFSGSISEKDKSKRMQCAIDDDGEMILTILTNIESDSSTEPDRNGWIEFRVDEVQLGKLASTDKGITLFQGTGKGGNSSTPADPSKTLIISIIAILAAILFGNAGGSLGPVPAESGGGPPSFTDNFPEVSQTDLGPWVRFDSDGDLQSTDPVTGQQRTFVDNGDGTYTDPLTGATYTPEELSGQMGHRADNADTIRQDQEQFERNVREDAERNKELSSDSKNLQEELQRLREERARQESVERIAVNLGMSGASEDEVRQELKRRLERDEVFRQKMNDYAKNRDTAVDILETVVEAVDFGMAIGEVVVPGGQTVSAVYQGAKNVVETVGEKGASLSSLAEGVVKGGTDAVTTMMDSGIRKAATTIAGTAAGEVMGAVTDGKDITKAAADGLLKGVGNAVTGAVGDAVGDAAKSTSGKVTEKIVETALDKTVIQAVSDEVLKEKE